MKTYMEDRSGNYEPNEFSRQVNKAGFLGGGAAVFGFGLLVVSVVPLAGIVGIVGGIGIIAWGVRYFKKPLF